jgi:hypothetical protein
MFVVLLSLFTGCMLDEVGKVKGYYIVPALLEKGDVALPC